MAKISGEEEDKGQLNYHVILVGKSIERLRTDVSCIQMLYSREHALLCRGNSAARDRLRPCLRHTSGDGLRGEPQRICQNCSQTPILKDHRQSYSVLKSNLAILISLYQDYFDGVEQMLRTVAPSEVSSSGGYSRSALKKVVREFDAKDVRKHVDALFKRVEKHFTEASEVATGESSGIAPGTVMVGVWKACEEELLRITDIFAKRISQCYASSGVSLEYSAADVEAAFKRHRIGS
jgi:hypothetical protein